MVELDGVRVRARVRVRVKGEGEGYLWWNSTKQKPHGVFV